MEQLENMSVVKGEGVTPPTPSHTFLKQASWQLLKDGVNGFSSTSDMCSMPNMHPMEQPAIHCVSGPKIGFYDVTFLNLKGGGKPTQKAAGCVWLQVRQ